MARLRFLVAVGFLVGAFAGCGGGFPEEHASVAAGEPIGFERLSRAAATSADASSGRFSFGLEVTMPGATESFAFSGEGAFDAASERASFAADLSSFAVLFGGFFDGLGAGAADAPDLQDPDKWRIDAVRDGSTTYLHFPAIAGQLPDGKSWLRSVDGPASTTAGLELGQLAQFTDADPGELLELLQGLAGDVKTLGTETLRGEETTHYRAVLDPSTVASSVPDVGREDVRALADQLVRQSGTSEVPLDV